MASDEGVINPAQPAVLGDVGLREIHLFRHIHPLLAFADVLRTAAFRNGIRELVKVDCAAEENRGFLLGRRGVSEDLLEELLARELHFLDTHNRNVVPTSFTATHYAGTTMPQDETREDEAVETLPQPRGGSVFLQISCQLLFLTSARVEPRQEAKDLRTQANAFPYGCVPVDTNSTAKRSSLARTTCLVSCGALACSCAHVSTLRLPSGVLRWPNHSQQPTRQDSHVVCCGSINVAHATFKRIRSPASAGHD